MHLSHALQSIKFITNCLNKLTLVIILPIYFRVMYE